MLVTVGTSSLSSCDFKKHNNSMHLEDGAFFQQYHFHVLKSTIRVEKIEMHRSILSSTTQLVIGGPRLETKAFYWPFSICSTA